MSKIIGIGLDLCGINRIRDACSHEHFLQRCFTENERSYAAGRGAGMAQSLAAMFAAKEALLKALGTGIRYPLTDIEIIHDPSGRPAYRLSGEIARLTAGATPLLSLTHEADTAAAVCVLQSDQSL